MKRLYYAIYLLGMIFSLSACSLFSAKDPLAGTEWKLDEIKSNPSTGDPAVTITFKDGKVTGSGGCNGYAGGYSLNDQTVTFEQIASTLMACTPQDVMDQEQKYFQALSETASYKIDKGQLDFLDKSGTVILRFSKPDVKN